MFQEFVNRVGVDVPGGSWFLRRISPIVPPFATMTPLYFYMMVLGGEEPIDHLQKTILRGGDQMHPLMSRIMEIHVAEEARHISFAHSYMEKNAPQLGFVPKFALSLLMPFALRVMADMIAKPPVEFRDKFDIPQSVIDDLYWDSPESSRTLVDIFADMRSLARKSGLINPVSKLAWKAFGIWGRSSRYRSEPAR